MDLQLVEGFSHAEGTGKKERGWATSNDVTTPVSAQPHAPGGPDSPYVTAGVQ